MRIIKISEKECEKYEYQIINAMLDVYNKIKDENILEIKIEHEMKIILETLKAGHEEEKKIRDKIKNEDLEKDKDGDSLISFWPSIETFLLSCVAGGIIWGEDKIPHNKLNPCFIGGDRLRALVKAMRLMEACTLLEEIKDTELVMHDSQHEDALKLLDTCVS
jgi:hypothetical protein